MVAVEAVHDLALGRALKLEKMRHGFVLVEVKLGYGVRIVRF